MEDPHAEAEPLGPETDQPPVEAANEAARKRTESQMKWFTVALMGMAIIVLAVFGLPPGSLLRLFLVGIGVLLALGALLSNAILQTVAFIRRSDRS